MKKGNYNIVIPREKSVVRKTWRFLRSDSWASLVVNLLLAFIIIKFLLLPGLAFVTGTELPLVIVESCSMYHTYDFEQVMKNDIYDNYDLSFEKAKEDKWSFQYGINKGDIIFVISPKNVEVGDVVIFNGGQKNPVIHRVVEIDEDVTTKGDHNLLVYGFDKNIGQEKVIGKAVFRVPLAGWVKLIFFEWGRPASERGLCV